MAQLYLIEQHKIITRHHQMTTMRILLVGLCNCLPANYIFDKFTHEFLKPTKKIVERRYENER
jgi:hypothetical protein